MVDTWAMMLIVPDAGLAALLLVQGQMEVVWPGASREVMTLIAVLMCNASLADALAVGLVTTMMPTSTKPTDRLSLVNGSAVLTGKARNALGRRLLDPWEQPQEVARIVVADVVVGGLSGLRAAG
jgi:hypothetical protein